MERIGSEDGSQDREDLCIACADSSILSLIFIILLLASNLLIHFQFIEINKGFDSAIVKFSTATPKRMIFTIHNINTVPYNAFLLSSVCIDKFLLFFSLSKNFIHL